MPDGGARVHNSVSYVTPPIDGAMTDAQFRRRRRWRRRDVARKVLPAERVAACGLVRIRNDIGFYQGATFAHYRGVESCSSVWHCAVCAHRIAEQRRQTVEAVLDAVYGDGGEAIMATFTLRHDAFDRVADVRNGVSAAWRAMQAGRPWEKIKDRFGIIGTVRAQEVTHGRNGWHPHIHVLLFVDRRLDGDELDALEWRLFDRWAARVAKVEGGRYGPVSRAGFDFRVCQKATAAGDYLAKWGDDYELSHGHMKVGRSGRTPFQMLDDAAAGDAEAARLFRDFGQTFKGTRQLTWSREIRARFGIPNEPERVTETALSASENFLGALDDMAFEACAQRGLLLPLHEAIEGGGWNAAVEFLQVEGVANVA